MKKSIPKFGAHEVIQFIGVSDLAAEEQSVVKELCTAGFEKLKRELHNIVNLTVHIKVYQKEGERKKYSMHLKVNAPMKELNSTNADWELPRVIHKSFDDVKRQIQHRLHTDVTRPRS